MLMGMTLMATVLSMSVLGFVGLGPMALLTAGKWLPLAYEIGMVLTGLAIAIPIPYLEKIEWEGRASK